MKDINDQIEAFFEEYEKRFAAGLAGESVEKATSEAFADYFVEASPMGVMGSKNDESFLNAVPKGYEFYKSIGVTEMKIRQIDITELDPLHYMVDIRWESVYQKDGSEGSIEFSVIYFLQHLNEKLKVFTYITGDEQKVLKEHGLV